MDTNSLRHKPEATKALFLRDVHTVLDGIFQSPTSRLALSVVDNGRSSCSCIQKLFLVRRLTDEKSKPIEITSYHLIFELNKLPLFFSFSHTLFSSVATAIGVKHFLACSWHVLNHYKTVLDHITTN